MNLGAFPVLFLTILFHQAISQEEELTAPEDAGLNKDDIFAKHSCDKAEIQQLIVDRHNELRSQVFPRPSNMLKMQWSAEAAANAAKWAAVCAQVHSKPEQRVVPEFHCGENLYMSNKPHNWIKVIQGWYDECNDFEYGVGAKAKGKVIGHYTQLSWYKTWMVGCASFMCKDKALRYYYVCQYCPAGNEKNSLFVPYTTGELCANCTHACSNGLCTNPCPYEDDYEECPTMKDLCDSEEEGYEEEEKIKNVCAETCNCDAHI
ncbi:cysteine-rich venom protein TEL1-like [Pseudophryne corroboree]|uniref:cysteine-rich venom protein TEL1-like n=1 Tax=Pseudophryne corroboree TaxID=495146 RepID=UPI003081FBFE